MPQYEFDTRAALLKSGKQEFLARGYSKASLRTICANANVTTGAFYANFAAKDDLFRAIVEDDLKLYGELYDGLINSVVSHLNTDDQGEAEVMGFIMDHRDLFRLLFDCSEGSSYEGFKESLLAKFDSTYQQFFDSYTEKPIDPAITRTVVRMKFAQYCEMIYGDYDQEKVMEITRQLADCTRAGFEALLNTTFESPS